MSVILADRELSGFPLSIGTGLAFESLFPPRMDVYDPERVIEEKINFTVYNELWVNVETLFRNMLSAAPKEALVESGHIEVANYLIDEMDTILSLCNNEGQGMLKPVFYIRDYSKVVAMANKAVQLRQDKTPNQLLYTSLKEKTFKELKRLQDNVRFFDRSMSAGTERPSVLIFTHYPYDLLSKRLFSKLDLLESNTGRLKRPKDWNSKYYPVPKRDMKILPFMRPLLLVLGDKPLIQPMGFKLRAQILDCAEKFEWTPMTTIDKVMLDLSLVLHPFDYAVISSLRGNA